MPKGEDRATFPIPGKEDGSPEDVLELSPRASALFAAAESLSGQDGTEGAGSTIGQPVAVDAATFAAPVEEAEGGEEGDGESALDPEADLSEEEQREVEKLKGRDREVRAHEQAHLAAAGSYAQGGPAYDYQRGPDNRQYAVGGEVQIDTSKVADDPEATIRKAQVIRRAAMAPAEPSSQDRRVASEAAKMETEARQEVAEQRREEMSGEGGEGGVQGIGKRGEGEANGAEGVQGSEETTEVELIGGESEEKFPDADVDFSGHSAPSGASFVDRAGGSGGAGQLLDLIA